MSFCSHTDVGRIKLACIQIEVSMGKYIYIIITHTHTQTNSPERRPTSTEETKGRQTGYKKSRPN